MVKLPFFRKNYRYVLKARNPKGEWEELGEYSQYIGVSDIMDIINEYREMGYTSFRLDVYDGSKFVKRAWTRTYPKKEERKGGWTIDDLIKLSELQQKIKEALGIKEIEPQDIIANIMYWESIKEELAKRIKTSTPEDEISGFLKLLSSLRSLASGLPMTNPTPSGNPSTAPTNSTPPKNLALASNLPPEVEKEVNEILTNAEKKVEDALTPPCMKEKCEEE